MKTQYSIDKDYSHYSVDVELIRDIVEIVSTEVEEWYREFTDAERKSEKIKFDISENRTFSIHIHDDIGSETMSNLEEYKKDYIYDNIEKIAIDGRYTHRLANRSFECRIIFYKNSHINIKVNAERENAKVYGCGFLTKLERSMSEKKTLTLRPEKRYFYLFYLVSVILFFAISGIMNITLQWIYAIILCSIIIYEHVIDYFKPILQFDTKKQRSKNEYFKGVLISLIASIIFSIGVAVYNVQV